MLPDGKNLRSLEEILRMPPQWLDHPTTPQQTVLTGDNDLFVMGPTFRVPSNFLIWDETPHTAYLAYLSW